MAITSLIGTNAALAGLDLHASSHKKGVHGDSKSEQSADPASSTAPLGTTQHLFSHLMDSAEEMIGVNPGSAARKL